MVSVFLLPSLSGPPSLYARHSLRDAGRMPEPRPPEPEPPSAQDEDAKAVAPEPDRSPGHPPPAAPKGRHFAVLSLGALGVVYGDIGTSPLYALRESLPPRARGPTHPHERPRGALAHLLVLGRDDLDQVPRLRAESGQSGRGRHSRADRSGHSGRRSAGPATDPGPAGPVRHRAPVRRGHDHARDHRALRGGGSRGRDLGVRALHPADHHRDPGGAVLLPEAGHRRGGTRVRARHAGMVHHDRGAGLRADFQAAECAGRREPSPRGAFLPGERRAGITRAEFGRAGDHRGGSAVRRHGALRPPAHSAGVVRRGVAGIAAELPGTGRAHPRRHGFGGEPVLPDGAHLGSLPGGRDRHRGRRDRLPGAHHGRVLAHHAGGAARLQPARDDRAHVGGEAGTDLRARHQLDP